MKFNLTLLTLVITLAVGAHAQKLAKPSTPSKPSTDAQQKLINEGVKLHDAKRFGEAIAKYRAVLAENPDCTAALYELTFSLEQDGQKEKAMEAAYQGSKYISDELPLFYVTIANILDDYGKPNEAINIYKEGLKLLSGDTRFKRYRSSLNYNLGVTYVNQKSYDEARKALKEAVEDDPHYASPHYLLAIIYNGTSYKIPAFLAATRLISLEANSARTARAAAVIGNVLKPAAADAQTGNINIFLNINAPKDEGDFGMYELLLGTLLTIKSDKDKDKTEAEVFIGALDSLISMIEEDKKLRSTFVGKNYVPFVSEMKKNGMVEPFGYLVRYQNGDNLALKWLQLNDAKLKAFLDWANAYTPPAK